MDFKNHYQQSRSDGSVDGQDGEYQIPTRGEFVHGPSFSSSLRAHHHAAVEQQEHVHAQEDRPKKIVPILEKFITFCLGALFFGVPVFFTGLAFQGSSFEKQIYFYFWILLALVAWVSKGVVTGEMKIRRTPLDIPLLLFWAVYGIAMFFSVDRWHSFWGYFGDPSRGFMNVTALVLAYYLVVSNFDKKKFFQMTGVLVVSDFIIALWSLFQIMGVHVTPEKWNQFLPLSAIGSLTGLGIFLGAMIPLVVTLIFAFLSEKSFKQLHKREIVVAALLFVTLLLNLFVLLVLYAFVSWLGVLVGVSFFLVYILAQIVRPAENWSWIPMVVFVAILAILMVRGNTIARVQLPVEVSPAYQLSWDVAKNSLKNAFVIGSGPATYGYDFSLYKPQYFNLNPYYNLRFSQGSGVFFEALSTIGVLGTIMLLLLALTFLSIGVYLLSTDKKRNKLYSLGIFSASLIVLINAFAGKVEGPIIALGVLLSSLAVAMLLEESEAHGNHLTLSLKASPKYALALAFVFMVVSAGVVFLFVFVGKIYLADVRAGFAMREQKITKDGSVLKLASAISWNSYESRYFTLLGQELMTLANEETLKGEKDRNLGLIQDYLNNSIASANQAKTLAPRDVAAVESLGQIYENSGLYVADSFSLAEENYKKALELEPHNPIYSVKLGQIKLAQASSKKTPEEAKAVVGEAKDLFQKAIDEKQNFAVAYYQLALSKEALGDLDGAVSSIEQAALNDQGNVNYLFNAARLHQARGKDDDMKIAEAVYNKILESSKDDANVNFSLGTLYEKTNRKDDAVKQYQKVLGLLPQDSADIKTQIEKMISNIKKGIANTPENLKDTSFTTNANDQSVPAVPTSSSQNVTPGTSLQP